MEIKYKEYKRIRRKHLDYFASPVIFDQNQKKHQIQNQLPRHDRMAKEPSHATVLLNHLPAAGITRPRS
jgi:hypothetical protein